jgi:hypothetical protein
VTDQYLPQPWIDAWATWAPYLLAALVVTTALVHLLLPVARIVERWARASAVTWDDAPARRLVEILTWLASLTALLISLIPRLAMGGMREDDPGPQPRRKRQTMREPVEVLVLAVLFAAAPILTACGPSAIATQADLVAIGAIATAGADEVLIAERARALDAVVSRAEAECPSGCDEERAEAYRVELAATEARWAPVLACRLPVVEALRSWLDGLDTARVAATESVGLALLARLGLRFAAAYSALAVCVEAAAPDADLPALPAALSALGGGE